MSDVAIRVEGLGKKYRLGLTQKFIDARAKRYSSGMRPVCGLWICGFRACVALAVVIDVC